MSIFATVSNNQPQGQQSSGSVLRLLPSAVVPSHRSAAQYWWSPWPPSFCGRVSAVCYRRSLHSSRIKPFGYCDARLCHPPIVRSLLPGSILAQPVNQFTGSARSSVVQNMDACTRIETECKSCCLDQMSTLDRTIAWQIAYGRRREHCGIWFPSECLPKAMKDQLSCPLGKTLALCALVDQVSPQLIEPFLQQLQIINCRESTTS